MAKAEWDTFRNVNNPTVTAHVDRSARFMIVPVFNKPATVTVSGYRVVSLIENEDTPSSSFATYREAKTWAEGALNS